MKKARAGLASQAEINVGYAPSRTVEILPRVLRAFRGSFPKVRVTFHDLSPKEMLSLLLQKKMDIALTVPPRKLPRELEMKELERYELCVAVGATHPLAKLRFISIDQGPRTIRGTNPQRLSRPPQTSRKAVRHYRPQAAHRKRARQREFSALRRRGRA